MHMFVMNRSACSLVRQVNGILLLQTTDAVQSRKMFNLNCMDCTFKKTSLLMYFSSLILHLHYSGCNYVHWYRFISMYDHLRLSVIQMFTMFTIVHNHTQWPISGKNKNWQLAPKYEVLRFAVLEIKRYINKVKQRSIEDCNSQYKIVQILSK